MRKAQSNIAGFLILTLIVLVIAGMTFFWAKPMLEKSNNFNEVQRIENRMTVLHKAIKEVANEHTQRTVSFDIKEGWLTLVDNRTLTYSSYMELPGEYETTQRIIIGDSGNFTYQGPCKNSTLNGELGYDEPVCLIEGGSIELKLKYIILNDTTTSNCYGIMLEAGDNAKIGKGAHNILLKYERTNTTNLGGCNSTTRQVVSIDMR